MGYFFLGRQNLIHVDKLIFVELFEFFLLFENHYLVFDHLPVEIVINVEKVGFGFDVE